MVKCEVILLVISVIEVVGDGVEEDRVVVDTVEVVAGVVVPVVLADVVVPVVLADVVLPVVLADVVLPVPVVVNVVVAGVVDGVPLVVGVVDAVVDNVVDDDVVVDGVPVDGVPVVVGAVVDDDVVVVDEVVVVDSVGASVVVVPGLMQALTFRLETTTGCSGSTGIGVTISCVPSVFSCSSLRSTFTLPFSSTSYVLVVTVLPSSSTIVTVTWSALVTLIDTDMKVASSGFEGSPIV